MNSARNIATRLSRNYHNFKGGLTTGDGSGFQVDDVSTSVSTVEGLTNVVALIFPGQTVSDKGVADHYQ